MDPLLIAILALVAIVVLLAMRGFRIVPQTENWLVERLGKYQRTLAAGVHIIVPLYENVAHKESIVERQLPVKQVPAITKDNVQIEMKLAILYRVTDAARAWYRIKNIDQAIETVIISVVRSTIGSSELDQVQSNRTQLSTTIASEIQHVTEEWGINVTRVEIVDIEVDSQTKQAMQLQLNAERTRRAVVTDAQGRREAANLAADAELYMAQRKAEAQRVLADAEAYAVQTVAKAINDNGQAAIEFQIKKIQADSVKAIGESASSKLVIVPADALSSLTGVLGRILRG
jgi:regulator of protease activity HflC (stomatin/prohibitin superfamily)